MVKSSCLGLVLLAVVGLICAVGVAEGKWTPPPPPLCGTIVSTGTDGTFVVQPKDPKAAQVTVVTDGSTKFEVNEKNSTFAGLAANMLVTVQPPTGTATRDAHSPPPPPPLCGTIVSTGTDGTFVVQPKDPKAAQVTVVTDGSTKFEVNEKNSTFAGLAANMLVTVRPPTGTATRVDAHSPPPPPPLCGTIVSTGTDGTFVVQPKDPKAAQVTVVTDGSTKFVVNEKSSTFAGLVANMLVAVQPPTGTATSVRAYTPPPPPPLYGTIVSVGPGLTFIVQPWDPKAAQVTVVTDGSTKFVVNGKSSTFAGLAANMLVAIVPPTGNATSVYAATPPVPWKHH